VIPRPWEAFGEAWEGASRELWARRLGVPQLEVHWEIPSTNGRLLELARTGAPPFTTVVAVTQSQGRGRGGKPWHSPPGAGLWMSCLLPSGRGGATGVLPLAVGVATALALESVARVCTALKWPNDLLLDGRKLAGILCEASGDFGGGVVVGIGINLRRPPEGYPPDLSWGAEFLEERSGCEVREPRLVATLVSSLREWASPPPERLVGALAEEWERRDYLRDRMVRLDDGRSGRALGVSSDGRLLVRTDDGATIEVLAGALEPHEAESSVRGSEGDPTRHRNGGT
jgi:BirA family transcriptional regulator, biotin operon repressor / biotin---[acetyl-CoA-carboxylase] ligase